MDLNEQIIATKKEELRLLILATGNLKMNLLGGSMEIFDTHYVRPKKFLVKDSFLILKLEKKANVIIDQPLRSYIEKYFESNEKMNDKERHYVHYGCNKPSNSMQIINFFMTTEFNTPEEVIITAFHLILLSVFKNDKRCKILELLEVNEQENLDLGIILLPKIFIKGLHEPLVPYNVHLEFLKPKDGEEMPEIHVHLVEAQRGFKAKRQGLRLIRS